MENKIQLMSVDKLPLIEEAFASIDNMEKFCNKILDSKLAPDHFYPKLAGSGDRDYTKGNTAAVMMVLIHGNQLHLPVLTSLQQIVPVNGLLSIKGDGAKGMILGSGKIQVGSWTEEESGSLADGTYSVTITAERSDTHERLSRIFSVAQAKRAGLWITDAQVSGADGWKYKKSSWYKYPDRMVKYRALGFLARDLFPDVMGGTYTTEEAMDMPRDTTEVIETSSGATLTLPDKDHAQRRSNKMTDRVVDKIKTNEFAPVNQGIRIQDAVAVNENVSPTPTPTPETVTSPEDKEESPFVPGRGSVEYMDGKEANRTEGAPKEGDWTLKEMEDMDTEVLKKVVMEDMDMMEGCEMIEGKNTNKKLRYIIFAHQEGRLAEYVAENIPKPENPVNEQLNTTPIANSQTGEIIPNKEFDNFLDAPAKKPEVKTEAGNKYGLEIHPEMPRDFSVVKGLFNKLMGITPQITTPRYMDVSQKVGLFTRYPDKEAFLKSCTVEEFNLLLNNN